MICGDANGTGERAAYTLASRLVSRLDVEVPLTPCDPGSTRATVR